MNIPEKNVFSYQYQLGQNNSSRLCGTACVLQYAPHHSLMYKNDELIQFSTKEQCLKIIDIIKKPNKLENYKAKFSKKTL